MRTLPLLSSVLLALAACGGPVRVDLEPGSVQLFGRGQVAKVHATPREKNGKAAPDAACRWASSDEHVVTVTGGHNDATVTSVAPGTAEVSCTVGEARASLPASVRVVAQVTAQRSAELTLRDERAPLALEVKVKDDAGALVAGRIVYTRCESEEVCRGDARGQLWAVGPGATRATVEVEGVSTTVEVTVKDERTEATRPTTLRKGYMEDLEREVARRQAAEAGRK
jgi:Bacterial Ig-like domain (group 2)